MARSTDIEVASFRRKSMVSVAFSKQKPWRHLQDATWRLSFVCVAFSAGAATLAAQTQTGESEPDPANPEATKAALRVAEEIRDRALAIDRARSPYEQEFVDRLAGFYRYGTGTALVTGDPIVTRRFCRQYILGLLRDLFIVQRPAEPNSERTSGFQNPLDEESARRLRGLVIAILATAHDDLDERARVVLYRVSELAFTRDHLAAIELLKLLAERFDPNGAEAELIAQKIETIRQRQ